MKERITGERIKEHFHYDWFKYVAVFLACIFVFFVAYTWMGNLRVYERLEGFITCYNYYDETAFEEAVVDHLNSSDYAYSQTNSVKEVSFYTLPENSPSWGETLSAYCMDKGTIIVVLPESKMADYANWFFPLKVKDNKNYEQRVWNRIIPSELKEWYENEENLFVSEDDADGDGKGDGSSSVYGLRIDNLPNISSAMKFTLTPEEAEERGIVDYVPEKYYLLVHYRNYNIGEFGMKPKYYSHAEGFEVVRFFLSRYGVTRS